MIDHGVHGIFAARFEQGNCGHDQRKAPRAAGLGQSDQPRMDRLSTKQRFEVAHVLGDNDAILGNAVLFDRMVELTASSDMQRVDGVMAKAREFDGKSRRKAFIDKESHPSRRPPRHMGGTSGERMGFGEQDRRFENFSRQVRIFGGDFIKTVAMGKARQDRMDG